MFDDPSAEPLYEKAFSNVVLALELAKTLPDQVFDGIFSDFFFLDIDFIFSPKFPVVISRLLKIDSATACCLLNITKTAHFHWRHAATVYLNASTTGEQYYEQIAGNSNTVGWILDVGRYGCTSDKGEWVIYCERPNDVAVIAFRNKSFLQKVFDSVPELELYRVGSLLDDKVGAFFPYSHLTRNWETDLRANYEQKQLT